MSSYKNPSENPFEAAVQLEQEFNHQCSVSMNSEEDLFYFKLSELQNNINNLRVAGIEYQSMTSFVDEGLFDEIKTQKVNIINLITEMVLTVDSLEEGTHEDLERVALLKSSVSDFEACLNNIQETSTDYKELLAGREVGTYKASYPTYSTKSILSILDSLSSPEVYEAKWRESKASDKQLFDRLKPIIHLTTTISDFINDTKNVLSHLKAIYSQLGESQESFNHFKKGTNSFIDLEKQVDVKNTGVLWWIKHHKLRSFIIALIILHVLILFVALLLKFVILK